MAPRGAAEAKPMEDVDQRRVRRHPVHRPLAYRLTHIASTLCCVCRPLCLRFLGPEFLWVRSQDSNTALIYHWTEFFSRAPCGQPPKSQNAATPTARTIFCRQPSVSAESAQPCAPPGAESRTPRPGTRPFKSHTALPPLPASHPLLLALPRPSWRAGRLCRTNAMAARDPPLRDPGWPASLVVVGVQDGVLQ